MNQKIFLQIQKSHIILGLYDKEEHFRFDTGGNEVPLSFIRDFYFFFCNGRYLDTGCTRKETINTYPGSKIKRKNNKAKYYMMKVYKTFDAI